MLSSIVIRNSDKSYADLVGFQTPMVLRCLRNQRACTVISQGEVYAAELSVTNIIQQTLARVKEQRYRNLDYDVGIE